MLTEGQLERRKSGLGGSDIAAVLGISLWATPIDIWMEKTEKVAPRVVKSEVRLWGTVLEPVILSEYARRMDVGLYSIPVDDTPVRHPERSWQCGTPDSLIIPGWLNPEPADSELEPGDSEPMPYADVLKEALGGLECKAVGMRKSREWGDSGTDEVPRYYRVQSEWYRSIFGFPVWEMVVLIGGQDFRVYTLPKSERLENHMLEKAERFWTHNVQGDNPPEPLRESDAKAVARLAPYYEGEKSVLKASGTQSTLIDKWSEAKAERKAAEEREGIIKAKLGLEMQLIPKLQTETGSYAQWQKTKGGGRSLYYYGP